MLVHGLSKTFENPWCHTTGLSKLLSPVVALRYHDLVASPRDQYRHHIAWQCRLASPACFYKIGAFMDLDFLTHTPFWIALGQIIIIDILLGGDNAVVIALACRKLPPDLRRKGIIFGTAGAIILRVILIAFAMYLLALPFLKFVGAILLFWIGVKLLVPEDDDHGDIQGSDKLFAAIKTIIVADLVMSVDNVIAIAGAAQNSGEHQMLLIVLGLLISIPIIVWGSQLVIKLMERFPMVITLGGMLLGWIAGGMLVSDPVFANTEKWTWMFKIDQGKTIHYAAAAAGALLVLALGKYFASKKTAELPANNAH